MKKIIALLLSVIIILSALPAFADDTTLEFDYSESMGLLTALGVFPEDLAVGDNVSRADFAYYLARLFMDESSIALLSTYAIPYTDCGDLDDTHKGAVSFLYSQGAISPADKFNPSAPAKLSEAIKMTVILAANKYYAIDAGGWYAGYRAAAKRAGLLDGIMGNDNDSVTVGDMSVLLFNALDCPEIISYLVNDKFYAYTSDRTLGEALFGLHKAEGIFTDNGTAAVYGISTGLKDRIYVDDTEYIADENVDRSLLGCYVDIYYIEDRAVNKAVYVYADSSCNAEISIYSNEIIDYSDNVYLYEDDEHASKTKKLKLDDNYSLIYNGYAVYSSNNYSEACMMPVSGSVRLLDNTGDNVYDVVFIESFETVQVSEVNLDKGILYYEKKVYDDNTDSYETVKNTFNFDIDDVTYEYLDDNGEVFDSYSVLARGNVVSIAKSLDGDNVKFIQRTKTVRGAVSKISERTVNIGDSVFEVNRKLMPEMKLDMFGEFWYDERNELIYFSSGADNGVYAYVIGAAPSNDRLNSKMLLKMLLENDSVKIMTAKDTLEVDGVKVQSEELPGLIDGLGNDRIIKIKFNSKDEIYWIDTVNINRDSTNHFRFMDTTSKTNVYAKEYILATGKHAIKPGALIFMIPESEVAEDTAYRVCSAEEYFSMVGSQVSDGRLYTAEDSDFIADIFVIKSDNSDGASVNMFSRYSPYIVERTYMALNDNGDVVPVIEVRNHITSGIYYGTDANSFKCKFRNIEDTEETIVDIETGDLVQFGYNRSNEISASNIVLLYDASRHESGKAFNTAYAKSSSNNFTTFNSSNNVKPVWIMDIANGLIRVACSDPATTENPTTFVYPENSNTIFVYDSWTKKVKVGSSADLVSYNGADGISGSASYGVMYTVYVADKGALYVFR